MSRLGKNIFYFLFLLTTIIFVNAPCFGLDDGDFQFWSTASANLKINKQWNGKFEEEFRFGDDAGELYYQHSDLGFVYEGLAEWIDFGLNYRLVFEKDGACEWRRENRPHFNVTLKGPCSCFRKKAAGSDLSVSNRSRFEYRNRENENDMWRYRNKTTLKFPVKLTTLGLQPYLADEVFINFGEQDINRNRFYAGVALNLLKQLKGEAYYLLQSSKSNGIWIDFHVLGIQLKIYF